MPGKGANSGDMARRAVKLGTLNLPEWTMREWTYQHGMARVDNAGVDNAGVDNAGVAVRDNAARTNNILESFHASLRRRMKAAHLYAFLGHLQRMTVDNQADITRLDVSVARRLRGVL